MRHSYEAVLVRDESGWCVTFPQIPEAISQGVPPFEHSAECVSISVEVGEADIEESHYMTQEQACDILGVKKSRVSQLAKSGVLESRVFGRRNMVSVESVERYARSPRRAGRPRKDA